MLILGIDPGTATTGYGFVEVNGEGLKVGEWGLIETSKDTSPELRLSEIFSQMNSILAKNKPDVFVIEKLFFASNAKTAIRVGQAQGVFLLSAAGYKIPVVEYAPGTIKKTIAGSGRADKKMMQKAIRKILGNHVKSAAHKKTHFDNAADALAIAVCHAMALDMFSQKGGEE